MPKTIRIDDEKIHEELVQLFLNLQAEKGKPIKMEDLLRDMLRYYKRK
ncbi:MAG: hypothetical protein KGH99_06905 [Thaumarchaeota archaeon]|nr:hypothetical protein [Nitrososphaerota archaeon]